MIQFGNDKIQEIYVGSDKIKEVYHGSQLVYGSSFTPFNGVLYDNGFEGVEWEQGFTSGTSGTNWLLDKSQNYLGAQVMARASGAEAAWTTKNAVDISNYNNLKVVFDMSAYPNNVFRIGIFGSTGKNNTAYGNTTYINNTFNPYLYYQSGSNTNRTVNIPITITGEHYISVNAVKLNTANYTGFIKLKKAVLEILPYIMFLADTTDVGFEQGYKEGTGYTQIIPSNLHASSGSSWGINTIVSTNKVNATLFKTLRVNFRNNGSEGVYIGLVDNKLDALSYAYPTAYSSATGIDTVLDFDITGISGEKYIAMEAYGTGVYMNVSKVELLP